jgi:hypothetical protein
MATTNPGGGPLDETSKKAVENSPAQADSRRAERLDKLASLRSARNQLLHREQQRLSQLTDASDPFLANISQRIAVNTRLAGALRTMAVQSRTTPLAVDAHTAAIYGFVRNADGSPAVRVHVRLVDAKGNLLKEAGEAVTDAKGAFVLRLPAPAGQAQPAVFLEVMEDCSCKILFRSSESLTPVAGAAEYREIILDHVPIGPNDER